MAWEWKFEMVGAPCQAFDAALDVPIDIELLNLILSGKLPRDVFLLDGILKGRETLRGIPPSALPVGSPSRCGRCGIALREPAARALASALAASDR